jgi:hypothetical protein
MSDESVALNPDGKLCYLEKNNPYRTQSTQTQLTDVESIRITEDDPMTYLPVELYTRVDELQRYSRFIRLVSFIDLAMTLLNLGLEFPYFLAVSMISLCGYYGATNYNRTLLFAYMTYQYLKIIAKSLFIYYNYASKLVIIVIASEIYDMYIVVITSKLIKLINRSSLPLELN